MMWATLIIFFFITVATAAFTSTSSSGRLFCGRLISSRLKLSGQEPQVYDGKRESLPSYLDVRPCFYKDPDGKWKHRIQLKDLIPGQLLIGKKISSSDLLEATTGPKVFFECGVGRIDVKGNWQIVNSMLRLGKSYSKPSVIRKKAGRLAGKPVTLYVRKVCLDTCRLEVTLNPEDVQSNTSKIPASSLTSGEELIGKVLQVRPYGCIIDVGANRNGLLHIQKVADLYGKYIDKENGLEESGLERGAKIRVTVESNDKKRLFLDFPDEVKTLAVKEQRRIADETEKASDQKTEQEKNEVNAERKFESDESSSNEYDQNIYDASADEAAAWEVYATGDHEDDYDEDADIEDALGIGSY